MKNEDAGADVRSSTGVNGLDLILGGGLPSFSIYSIQGQPGTGKTTLALQFLMAGQQVGERGLYISFSETRREIFRVAQSHGWDLSKIELMDLSILEAQFKPDAQNTLFHPSEIELTQMTEIILSKIRETSPKRIVFDSVSEMRLLAESSLRYRRQILALKQILAELDTTVVFLDDLTVDGQSLQIHSIAHGVIHLSKLDNNYGRERRRVKILKLRGVNFISGHHDFDILKGGMVVYPRMVSVEDDKTVSTEKLASGLKGLDDLLHGGLDTGTANLLIGPAGTGKSTISMKYAIAACQKKLKVAYFSFDETLANAKRRCEPLGMNLDTHIKDGLLNLVKIDPAEMSPGAFGGLVREMVANQNVKVVCIDSLNGYIQAMPQEQFLLLQLHELLAYLNNKKIVTIMTIAQAGMIGNMTSPVDLTYLADTVILTRFFESMGAVKKAISVIKKRTGPHENTLREYSVGEGGLKVGPILNNFQGVLSGIPILTSPSKEQNL